MSANPFPTRVRDAARNVISIVGVGNPNTLGLTAGATSDYSDSATGLVYDYDGTTWNQRGTSSGGSTAWSAITGTPTTLGGYGITDALPSSYVPSWSSISGKPTTVAGYGITDALTTSYVPSWSSITGKPTTRDGYGLSDVYTKAEADARFLQLTGGTLSGSLTAPDFVLS